jgi:hypothetical protein
MRNASIRRKIALLVVVVGLAVPWETASAAGLLRESPRDDSAMMEILGRFWSVVQRVATKAGCSISPDGRCTQPIPQPKEGCHIDPSGRCTA